MNKTYLLWSFCLLSWLAFLNPIRAQENKKDKIDALRVAFITNKLQLSPKEAELFWPIYNEFTDKLEANRKSFRHQYPKHSTPEFKTDKEAEMYLAAEMAMRQKELDLTKEYYERFKKVLPLKKVAQLRLAEEEFKKELLNHLK